MSDTMMSVAYLALLLALILIRVPIGVSLIGVSFLGIGTALNWKVAWGSLGIIPYQFAANWVLSSVPTFLFMGFICYHTRLTQGLFDAARVWLARLPGGLAIASVFGCGGFSAVTGSSVACAAAMGRVAVPEMVRNNYSPMLATGTVAAAGTIGALIPPSILMIIYGIIAQVPISKLFLGGISIGLLTIACYVMLIVIMAVLKKDLAPTYKDQVQPGERLAALLNIWPVLLIVLGVFGGLFSGLFTPTEAGAVGAFLSCVVAATRGTLTFAALKQSAQETVSTTCSLLVIAVGASLLTRFLALSGLGATILDTVNALELSPYAIIFAIVVVYMLLGMVLEPMGAMLLTLPIFLPLVESNGFSLLWFGVLVTKLLEIGMITPPVGMNVFVIKSVVGNLLSTSAIFRGVAPFILADLSIVALMVALPSLVMFLPTFLGQ